MSLGQNGVTCWCCFVEKYIVSTPRAYIFEKKKKKQTSGPEYVTFDWYEYPHPNNPNPQHDYNINAKNEKKAYNSLQK